MKMRKFLASMAAVAVAVCSTAVTAIAAPDQILTCSLCESSIAAAYDYNFDDPKNYQEFYNVPALDGLISSNSSTTRLVYVDSADNPLYIAYYNEESICKDCLEDKIAEYKASANNNNIKSDTDGSASGSTNVDATVNSTCVIVIPETITLTKADATTGSGEYTKSFDVTVKGDMPEDATVNITASAPALKSTGVADVTSTLSMSKNTWNRADVIANSGNGTAANCTLKATLTPGTWTGTMTYNIAMYGSTAFDYTA